MKDKVELKKGDLVEVRDQNDEQWRPSIYLAFNNLFTTEYPHFVAVNDCGDFIGSYAQCRHRRPNLKTNAPIWVRDREDLCWQPGHFAGWDDNGLAKVFPCGETSHTSIDRWADSYNYYRTTPPGKEPIEEPLEDPIEVFIDRSTTGEGLDYADGYREGYDYGFAVAKLKYLKD